MRKVILDCDPGHDDAFAIMLAAQHLELLGITTIGGNGYLENVTTNALKVLEVIERPDVPVYKGHAGPLLKPLVTAPEFHGESGMDGPVLPEPKIKAQDQHAVDFIIETVLAEEGVTLIATGPLTNIAAALHRHPKITERIHEIVIMGGSVTFGNWTPAAEFNIYVDPEAASKVFNSGVLVKMTGVNLTRQCLITANEMNQFKRLGTKAGLFAADLVAYFIEACEKTAQIPGANLHDACAVAWVIDPSLITAVPMHIDVELAGELTRGMTVCDYRHLRGADPRTDLYRKPMMNFRGKAPNAEAALELDFPGFMDLLYRTLRAYR